MKCVALTPLCFFFMFFMVAVTTIYAGEIFNAKSFSVEIPEEMIIEIRMENNLSLVFPGDKELKKGSVILAATRKRVENFDINWRQAKETIVGKHILFEKYIPTPALIWKVIGGEGGVINESKAQEFLYYGESHNTSYGLHYFCLPGNCSDIESAVSKLLNTFRPIEYNEMLNKSQQR